MIVTAMHHTLTIYGTTLLQKHRNLVSKLFLVRFLNRISCPFHTLQLNAAPLHGKAVYHHKLATYNF